MCIDVSEVPSASGWIIIYIENTGSRSFGKSVTQSTEYKRVTFHKNSQLRQLEPQISRAQTDISILEFYLSVENAKKKNQ